jgi:hypothetical protein
MSPATFLERATRILFFTGKGGVGKTSLACATAVALARRGKKVLVVSTDPASNLDEVLGTPLSGEPTEIAKAGRLFALNVDPEAAAAASPLPAPVAMPEQRCPGLPPALFAGEAFESPGQHPVHHRSVSVCVIPPLTAHSAQRAASGASTQTTRPGWMPWATPTG